MAEKGKFGTMIPHMGEIVKIDGDKLIDKDGDEFSRGIVEINMVLGGGLERVSFKKYTPSKTKDKPE